MLYKDQREAFKRLLVQKGLSRLDELPEAMPFGCIVPQRIIERWLRNFLEVPTTFSRPRRFLNRFKLGADPEFVFVSPDGLRYNASLLGLGQGLAFGADNNGRLAEIRPHPSRSALDVVASLWVTLRWLSLIRPKAAGFQWVSGAFIEGDGLGGHVHFGRKRPGRDNEVKALDFIDELLILLQMYPVRDVMRRRQGDQHRQIYGMPGDIRPQMHGYEYRTFPSWLDSPHLAFLTLTLSKLAVQTPWLIRGCLPLPNLEHRRLLNLLAYFKDVDDDARLALLMLQGNKNIRHLGGDFRGRWGIVENAGRADVKFIPSSIKPSNEDIDAMFKHLKDGSPLPLMPPVPTWTPIAPPPGYEMVINAAQTIGHKGFGELLWDVCSNKECEYKITADRGGPGRSFFSIPDTLAKILPSGWERLCNHHITSYRGHGGIISWEVGRTVANLAESRRLLLETVFPFWSIRSVKPESWATWQATSRAIALKKHRNKCPMVYGTGPFPRYR